MDYSRCFQFSLFKKDVLRERSELITIKIDDDETQKQEGELYGREFSDPRSSNTLDGRKVILLFLREMIKRIELNTGNNGQKLKF